MVPMALMDAGHPRRFTGKKKKREHACLQALAEGEMAGWNWTAGF